MPDGSHASSGRRSTAPGTARVGGAFPSAPRRGRLKIAICLQELRPLFDMLEGRPVSDGTYIVQGHIAAGLHARGHDLTIVAPRDLQDVECATGFRTPETVARSWSAGAWFRALGSVAWRLQQVLGVPYLNVFSNCRHLEAYSTCLRDHDVVFERNALYSLAVARACRRLRLPYVTFFEADQLFELEVLGRPVTGLLRWRAARILRYNLATADCVTCVSEATKTRLTTTWNVPPRKIVVCPNGVDVERFRPDPGVRAEVRSSMGVGEGPIVIFAGSFFEWHDIGTLLDAFAQVLAARSTARLILVGDGHQRSAMERRALERGIGQAVTFTGLVRHDQVARLMAAADVAVAVYPRMQRELWLSPLKLFEYMASGAAVVASGTGQVLEVIDHMRNGILVVPGDATALSAAIGSLLDDPGLRHRLSEQARSDAVEQHSWARYVDRLEGVFDAAIASRGSRRGLEAPNSGTVGGRR